ncbi:TonB-linked SusC/RagA family outer membrane protein [Mucilaginibacter yixingensis]|uniref:TonB-linked SusC/RagA family outer membrane protein n=1 Tax=Mucilaginibacter yixingensis TaxID=1295612 RepID=A0A2T5JAJ2_9SPHI|nr:TonB-dependent receptor [Mucilaginibacter yixingensis]PTQ97877.1 TonB-linked SusC/RagA family outer membrane protein [Mucilaginibacter yixingensis]
MKRVLLQAFLLLLCTSVWAQTRVVMGKVTGTNQEALIGASLLVKGTSKGTATDVSGNYKLTVPASGQVVLVVKYIGYQTKEVTVGAQQMQVNVALQEDKATQLSEVAVVNIGYSSVSRNSLAGAVSSISQKDLKDFPVSTVAEALAGKLAGVQAQTSEGAPGADIKITIRGGGSLTQDNSPLYIVDGVPLDNALSIISPSEIQNIDVLKDVASTAIYGARGANGVVIITTKAGKKGRTIVSFDGYAGARKITNEIKVLDPYQFVDYQYELTHQHYNGGPITDTPTLNGFTRSYGNFSDLQIYKSFPTVDWQNKVFGRNALNNTQVLTVNGGTDASTYNFSINNTDEQGVMLASDLKRTFATFRWDNNISSKLRFGVNVRYSRQRVDGAGTSSTGGSSNNKLKYSVRFQPYQGLVNFQEYDPDAIFDNTINLSNPLTSALTDVRNAYTNNLITSGQVTYIPTPKLTIRSVVGYTLSDNKTNSFSGVANYSVSSKNSSSQYASQPFISISLGNNTNITNSNTIDYRTNIGTNHTIDVLLGQEINQNNGTSFNQTIKYFPSAVTAQQAFANVQQANPPSGAIQPSPTTDVTGDRLFSFFGRAMYSFKNKYNFNFLVRRDGSSKFSDANRWGTFPSAQFAWRITEEDFMKKLNLNWLSNLKLRASYGTAGNNRVSSDRLYQTIFTTSATDAGYAASDNSQTSGLYSANLANPNLKWETTISKDLGLDIELWGGRATLSVDGYINRVNDLLLQTNVPQETGYLTQYQNIGATQNKGLEIQLSGTIINKKDFNWNSSFNLSFNRNTIVALQGGVQSYLVSSGWGQSSEDFLVQVGQPVGLFYGYVSDGFYTLNDFDRAKSDPANYKWVLKPGVANSSVIDGSSNVFPGQMKLKKTTATADSVIRTTDRTVLGSAQPKFYGGWNNQFSYKSFDMSLFVNFSYGNKEYNANTVEYSSVYQANGNNVLAKFADRWRSIGPNGELMTNWDQIAAMNVNAKIYSPTRGPYQTTSDAIEDGSFLRITNLTLGYTLPTRVLQATNLVSRLRVYVTVNNLYTFTKYTGYDPEASTRRSNPLTPAVDYSAYPRSRYILAGVNLSF